MPHVQHTLWWDGRTGLANFGGMTLTIPRKPRVLALDIEQIDYMPRVHRWMVQEIVAGAVQPWRDLTREERAYIDAALARMSSSGIKEIC
jgi:hypothetical protein